ncbi:helix-turn-helix domain-containing protein [Flavicella sediminum]|uniref:helix-turn-helix domain-containing protein n=1 Tax=Flavicella sediminum TaxID=2585141 RepID=UPI001121188C|nr:helix-turn-helix domain-containing protein [Flavicella sediminum]
MQLTPSQKQEIVTKIRNSSTLKNAPTSSALLQYLHEATLKNTVLKEGVIDIEFFGSKEIEERNNPRVRVNVYNLRKKLVSYYTEEGKEDLWRLSIEKGQYKVSFAKSEIYTKPKRKINWKQLIPYTGLVIAIATIISMNTTPKAPKIWKSFLETEEHSNLFIGDHFGITGTTITNGYGWTRDFNINTTNEFYQLLDAQPELRDKIKPAQYSYSTRMSAITTQKLQELYQQHDRKFEIRFSTQTSIPEIKERNAIYVGPTKNKNQFLTFFNEGNPYCKIKEEQLVVSKHPEIKDIKIPLNSKTTTEEYAIVSKYASIGNKEHFVFFSQHDIGVSATVAYFTNLDSIAQFEKKYLPKHQHFTAIYKVKGLNRTDTNLKLIQVIPF